MKCHKDLTQKPKDTECVKTIDLKIFDSKEYAGNQFSESGYTKDEIRKAIINIALVQSCISPKGKKGYIKDLCKKAGY